MLKSGKKLMALCLSVLLIFGCLSACSNSAVTTPNTVPVLPVNQRFTSTEATAVLLNYQANVLTRRAVSKAREKRAQK